MVSALRDAGRILHLYSLYLRPCTLLGWSFLQCDSHRTNLVLSFAADSWLPQLPQNSHRIAIKRISCLFWLLVPWLLTLGSWPLAPGSHRTATELTYCFLLPASWLLAPSSWLLSSSSWLPAPGFQFPALGTWLLVPGWLSPALFPACLLAAIELQDREHSCWLLPAAYCCGVTIPFFSIG